MGTLPTALETVRQVLRQSPVPLTRQEILAGWPEGAPLLRADSLWRCLTQGCDLGLLVRTGAGTKAEAFRYGLALPKNELGLYASSPFPSFPRLSCVQFSRLFVGNPMG